MAGDVLKRLAGPAFLGTTAATLYTVPASTTAVVRDLNVANETGSAATFTLSIGADGAGKRLYKDVSVPANSTFERTGSLVLAAGEVLQGYASAGSTLTITASGVESS